MPVPKIAEVLGRSVSSINTKIDRLHLYLHVRKPWTEHEFEYVQLNYRHTSKSRKQIASYLGRSEGSVDFAIRTLGLQAIQRTRWSPEDDDNLRDLIGQYSVNGIAKILHKSVNVIVCRIKVLKLQRRAKDGWYTTGEVASILGCSAQKIRSYITSGLLKATEHYSDRHMFEIKRTDIKSFICKYPLELQNKNCDMVQIIDILVTNGIIYKNGS